MGRKSFVHTHDTHACLAQAGNSQISTFKQRDRCSGLRYTEQGLDILGLPAHGSCRIWLSYYGLYPSLACLSRLCQSQSYLLRRASMSDAPKRKQPLGHREARVEADRARVSGHLSQQADSLAASLAVGNTLTDHELRRRSDRFSLI